jgi:hypothetical protein
MLCRSAGRQSFLSLGKTAIVSLGKHRKTGALMGRVVRQLQRLHLHRNKLQKALASLNSLNFLG